MNEEDIRRKLRADGFFENNGIVLRAINIGRTVFNSLAAVRRALDGEMDRQAFTDCVNYLSMEGYIILRLCGSKQPANVSDNDIDDIEAKVSGKGVRLLAGVINDPCIRA